ncbi:M23 family metallopeptidase [Streptomyces sp. NPDC059740]|uniref:M23 family metallopeptidase n=1 Tax=Streptomyces sp. NPDC059740 TaxID=3346926 RepID=UPI003665024A
MPAAPTTGADTWEAGTGAWNAGEAAWTAGQGAAHPGGNARDTGAGTWNPDESAWNAGEGAWNPGDNAWNPGEGAWNPGEEEAGAPLRGRHRVVRQRGGGLARSSTVLGVGVIAAVGAGGMASADEKPPVSIALADVGSLAHDVAAHLPDASALPVVGGMLSGDDHATDHVTGGPGTTAVQADTAHSAAPLGHDATQGSDTAHAGEALRARILQQAEQQRDEGEQEDQESLRQTALKQAAADAEADRAKAEKEQKAAEEKARHEAEKKRLAALARSYRLPVTGYTLTAGFGQAGDMWSADHTGQDFAVPTGTPIKAVHSGTITSAGWAGSYGYRIVLTLDDGTELWFCHMSSMVRTSGHVNTGDVIGRVGATGNVTGPHLHLEVRPGGGDPIDPMPWLRAHGLEV